MFLPADDDQDYNRNLGLILGVIGSGVIAIGLLALDPRINHLRAGLLAGGAGLVLWGVGQGSSGSNDWLTIITAGLGLGVLLACTNYLENGLGRIGLPKQKAPPSAPPAATPEAPPPVQSPDDPGGIGGASSS